MSISKSLALITLSLLATSPVLAGPSARERAVREKLGERESESSTKRMERVQKASNLTTSVRIEDVQYQSTATISRLSGGKINSLQLDTARNSSYMIEIPKRSSNSSEVVEVKLGEMTDKLGKNIEALESTQTSRMSANQSAVHTQKMELAKLTAELITLGSKRYKGSNADLIMARDAFARQVETAVKMTGKETTAKLEEIKEHIDFVEAIVAEKKKNPSLSDAEATLRGVEKAYKDSFEKRCQDGSCKVPADTVLAAGAKNRLKELKECI